MELNGGIGNLLFWGGVAGGVPRLVRALLV